MREGVKAAISNGKVSLDRHIPKMFASAACASNARWRLSFLKVVVAVLMASGCLLLVKTLGSARPETTQALPPEHRRTSFAAPGLVESASGMRALAFPIDGRIKAVHVEENQAVKAGSVLAELEHADLDARLLGIRAELGVMDSNAVVLKSELVAEQVRAERKVDQLRAELARLQAGPRAEEQARFRAEARAAEIEWKRRIEDARRYSDLSISSRQERDMTESLAEVTRAQFEAAQAKVRELEAGSRKEDITKAEAALKIAEAEATHIQNARDAQLKAALGRVEQARAQVLAAEAELSKAILRSPVDGVVVWKYRHAGETVGMLPPEPVLSVAEVSPLRVRAEIDEADFPNIKPGMRVRIRAEAYGDRDFSGHVTSISPAAGQKRFFSGEPKEQHDIKVVETLVSLDQTSPFKLGLRVTAFFDGDGINGP